MVLGAASWMPCGMSYLGFAGIAIHIIIIISLDNKNVEQSDRLNCVNSHKKNFFVSLVLFLVKIK